MIRLNLDGELPRASHHQKSAKELPSHSCPCFNGHTLKLFPIVMDTTGDADLKLQRASADLIADLQRSLPHFLRKSTPAQSGHSPTASGGVRGLVRETKTNQLIKLVGSSHLQL